MFEFIIFITSKSIVIEWSANICYKNIDIIRQSIVSVGNIATINLVYYVFLAVWYLMNTSTYCFHTLHYELFRFFTILYLMCFRSW